MAACQAFKEAIWLRKLFSDAGFSSETPTCIYKDNQSCISLARNPTNHARTKHIDNQHHFVREAVEDKLVELVYCPTEDMIADILIKPLPKQQFEILRNQLGLASILNN